MIVSRYRRGANEWVLIERIGPVFVATLSNGLERRTWTSDQCEAMLAEIVLTEMHITILNHGFHAVPNE